MFWELVKIAAGFIGILFGIGVIIAIVMVIIAIMEVDKH